MICQGCKTVTRQEVEATVWINNLPINQELCDKYQEVNVRGLYRVLNDDQCKDLGHKPGCKEFVSICNSKITKFVSIPEEDFNRILDALLPRQETP